MKDTERRRTNNNRERVRIKDINEALCELGRVCRSLKLKNPEVQQAAEQQDDKPQTKLGILNTAVEVITALEREVRERNLNTSALAMRQTAAPSGHNYVMPPASTGAGHYIAQSSSPAQSSNSRPSSGGSSSVNPAHNGLLTN